MLHELERKLTAVIADGLSSRPNVTIVQAPAISRPAAAGRGVVRVGVAEIGPQAGFDREQFVFRTATERRRVLSLTVKTVVDFFRLPAADTPEALSGARSLLLEDMSLVSHRLSAADVRNGQAFRTPTDAGFEMQSFELRRGTPARQLADGVLVAELEYEGRAQIWPAGLSEAGGPILAIDTVATALPISIVGPEVVPAGGTAPLRVRGANPERALAVTVLSDLPPAQRGAIATGTPGQETGVRIVAVAVPETVILYRAPSTGDLGQTRLEYVAVHLATPDNRTGVLLGSVAVRLQPGAP